MILGAYYQYPVDSGSPFVVEIPNKDSGISRTYRIAFNADLMDIFPTDKAIDISYEDYLELIDNYTTLENPEIWAQIPGPFPPYWARELPPNLSPKKSPSFQPGRRSWFATS